MAFFARCLLCSWCVVFLTSFVCGVCVCVVCGVHLFCLVFVCSLCCLMFALFVACLLLRACFVCGVRAFARVFVGVCFCCMTCVFCGVLCVRHAVAFFDRGLLCPWCVVSVTSFVCGVCCDH